jgi:hypothetical protein
MAALALFPVAFVDPRYWLPVTPGLLIWAADGLAGLTSHPLPLPPLLNPGFRRGGRDGLHLCLRHRCRQAGEGGEVLTALVCTAFLAACIAGAFLVPAPVEYKALGEWMSANHVGYGEVVLARKRQVPFYAGARWEWLPLADVEGLLAFADERSARYVVIDERLVPTLRPELAHLLDPAAAPEGLELVTGMTVGGMRILLYRVSGER